MHEVTIYYHDTDCGGVVYYANYLKYFEEARTHFFSTRGIPVKELAQKGTFFVVARQEVDYRAPAFYGDTLQVESTLVEMTSVRVVFKHTIQREGKVLVEGRTVAVCVGDDFKPKAIPKEVKKALA